MTARAPQLAALTLGVLTPALVSAQGALEHDLEGGVPLLAELDYSVELGAEEHARSLVVGGARAFAGYRIVEPQGVHHDAVQAFDSNTGGLLWTATLPGPAGAGMGIGPARVPLAASADGSRVYAQHREGLTNTIVHLTALDGVTGAILWDRVSPAASPGDLALSEAAGILVEASSTKTQIRVRARSTSDGSLLWEDLWADPSGGLAGIYGFSLTAEISADGKLAAVGRALGLPAVAQSSMWGVRVFDATNGALAWEATGGSGPMAMTEDGGALALIDGQKDIALIAGANGTPLWSAPEPGNARAFALDTANGRLYAAIDTDLSSAADAARIVAYDITSGSTIWSAQVDPWGTGSRTLELRASPDGTRLAVYLEGDSPQQGSSEALAVLLDAATGSTVGATGVGNDLGVVPTGANHGDQRLAFAQGPGELFVLGQSLELWVGPEDTDVLVERLALAGGAWLPRYEFDVLLPATLNATEAFLRDDGRDLIFAGTAHAGDTYALAVSIDTATGQVNWQRTDPPSLPLAWINPVSTELGDAVLDPVQDALYTVQQAPGQVLLRAVDAETGALLWEQALSGFGGQVSASFQLALAPAQGILYAVREVDSPGQERAVAVDVQTGALLWDTQSLGGFDGLFDQIVAVDEAGTLFVTGTAAGTGSLDPATRVSALAPSTGALLWTAVHGAAQAAGTVHLPRGLVAFGGRVYAAESVLLDQSTPTYRLEVRTLDALSGNEVALGVHDFSGLAISPFGLVALPELGLVAAAVEVGLPGDVVVSMFDAGTGAHVKWAALGEDDVFELLSFDGATDGSTLFLSGSAGAVTAGIATEVRAVDSDALGLLWSAKLDDELIGTDLAVSPEGESVVALALGDASVHGILLGTPPLLGAPPELSLATGGSQGLTLQAGTAQAGDWHLVLGSASGTAPGTPLDGFTLPLNPDAYLTATAASPGAPVAGALGKLTASVVAQATFQLPAGVSPSLAGLELHHAYATIRITAGVPAVTSVSNAVPVTLTP